MASVVLSLSRTRVGPPAAEAVPDGAAAQVPDAVGAFGSPDPKLPARQMA
ncbi:hypothetical protein [Kribbella antiqua]|nr:hypothetical protein [Kribbella antiqua]